MVNLGWLQALAIYWPGITIFRFCQYIVIKFDTHDLFQYSRELCIHSGSFLLAQF